MSANNSQDLWNTLKEQYKIFKQNEQTSKQTIPVPVDQITIPGISTGLYGSFGNNEEEQLNKGFKEIQKQMGQGQTPESKRKKRVGEEFDFEKKLDEELKRIEEDEIKQDLKRQNDLVRGVGVGFGFKEDEEDNEPVEGEIENDNEDNNDGKEVLGKVLKEKVEISKDKGDGKEEIDVDQDETNYTYTNAEEIAIDSDNEGSIKGFWLDFNDPKATSKLLKKSKNDSKFHRTTFSLLLEDPQHSPHINAINQAIDVDDEALKATEIIKKTDNSKIDVPVDNSEQVYLWPEPPKQKKKKVIPDWKKEIPKEMLNKQIGPYESRADLENLKFGFDFMMKNKRSLETLVYITPNKTKLTKNCKPDIFAADIRNPKQKKNRKKPKRKRKRKSTKSVISCEERPKKKRIRKKENKNKKKKEKKFTVKMQNMYII
jgi:hypothetical protein